MILCIVNDLILHAMLGTSVVEIDRDADKLWRLVPNNSSFRYPPSSSFDALASLYPTLPHLTLVI